MSLWESGELADRVERALSRLGDCALCPRGCHVDRQIVKVEGIRGRAVGVCSRPVAMVCTNAETGGALEPTVTVAEAAFVVSAALVAVTV